MTKEEKHPTPGADEKVRPTRRLIIIGASLSKRLGDRRDRCGDRNPSHLERRFDRFGI